MQYSSGNAVTRVTEAVLQNPSSGVRLKCVSLIPTGKPRASTQIMPQLLTVQCPILSQRTVLLSLTQLQISTVLATQPGPYTFG